ncbi:MAG: AarF/UbiB family protein, partial [Pseudomonadota bacterium]
FTQMLRHNFFHADMHPGNIFVLIEDPENPKYCAVDFGIVGTLDPADLEYLAGNFLAFFDRDYRRIAELHVDSGWVPRDTRVDELEAAVRTVCEPIFEKPLDQISFGVVLLRLFEVARRFRMEVQPQLVLLQKTLLNIEGLGRDLYPQLDLWQTAQPLLRAWYRDRLSPRAVLKEWRRQVPDLVESLKAAPGLVRRIVREGEHRDYLLRGNLPRLEELRAEIDRSARRTDRTIVACTLLGGGALWFTFGWPAPWLGAGLAVAAGAYLVLRR